jgi:hypothetical protein
LQELAELIDQNEQSNREEVLGVIMLLVYCEVVSASSPNENLAGLIMLARSTRKFQYRQWALEKRDDCDGGWTSSKYSDEPFLGTSK